jgi:hypothetical protein
MVEKYNENTIWSMSRITLAQEKAQFIGSPVKYVIDMEKTKVTPVLQSTTFPRTPTPPDSLATIVQLTRKQQVHFLALVRTVEKQRSATTSRGERTIVDVTFVDGSKLANGKMATITTAMFFTKTMAGEKSLKQLQDQTQPIVVVGAVCTPDSGKVNMLLGQEAYWFPCTSGAKAGHLMTMADDLRTQQDIEEIGKEKTWTAQEARDFKAETATQTTCAILNSILQQEESVVETLFQLNHVRVSEPGCGENIKTNDGARLFVPVRLLDFTGSVNLRMREQAAFLSFPDTRRWTSSRLHAAKHVSVSHSCPAFECWCAAKQVVLQSTQLSRRPILQKSQQSLWRRRFRHGTSRVLRMLRFSSCLHSCHICLSHRAEWLSRVCGISQMHRMPAW